MLRSSHFSWTFEIGKTGEVQMAEEIGPGLPSRNHRFVFPIKLDSREDMDSLYIVSPPP
ncbi:hypothetical protein [Kosmotoga pacifica]|uniref:hypothetical protein n=1 Tax=Kosmotoga pacifica TaxID=1330330 RepID=UPI0023522019|nr:hypothetical protein [Kosmotoga pacifica]